MKTQLLGRAGEARAAEYLRKKRYRILEAGYRSRYGEIDLIAQKGDTVAFVEVKLRKNDRYAPAYAAVTPAKQRKLKTTALQWMAEQGGEVNGRFDIIEIYTDDGRVNHIENAFE